MGQTSFIESPEELAEARNSACNTSPFRPGGADMCKLRSLHQVENVILSVSHFATRSFTSFGETRQALHCKAASYGRAVHGMLILFVAWNAVPITAHGGDHIRMRTWTSF